MDYCTEFKEWVTEIEKDEIPRCPVHIDQIFKTGKKQGCKDCRFILKTKGDKK